LLWKGLSLVQQRKAFSDEYLEQLNSVSELCRRFSVSRKTAYKWIDRFLAGCELTNRQYSEINNATWGDYIFFGGPGYNSQCVSVTNPP
jgi:hypothetical protein